MPDVVLALALIGVDEDVSLDLCTKVMVAINHVCSCLSAEDGEGDEARLERPHGSQLVSIFV